MSFKAAKCPSCLEALQVPDDRDSVKCMYCGVDIMVRQAIQLAAGKIKEFTNASPIIKAKGGVVGGVIALLFGLLLLASGNSAGVGIGTGLLIWAAILLFGSADKIEIGFEGECPYCDTHMAIMYNAIASPLVNKFSLLSPSLDTNGKIIGITCTACLNRIVVQGNKLLSIETAVTGIRKAN